jgi:hypothetical protein
MENSMSGAWEAWTEPGDARRFKRLKPERKAALQAGGAWLGCDIVEISGGGALIEVEALPPDTTHVVLCDADLGMIAATVERREQGRLALIFGIDQAEKERLTDTLTGLLNADLL